jgi:hypothetical protein
MDPIAISLPQVLALQAFYQFDVMPACQWQHGATVNAFGTK